MIQRVLETEVMDSPDEAQAYDTMDHEEVNRAFVDDLLRGGAPSGRLLDMGTGTARIPIELCRRVGPELTIRGIDLAQNMLDLALANVVLANLSEQIFLELADAKALPYPDNRFDGVISNSLLHHLADPAAALAEAIRVTRPGGRLFFRDLLRPVDEAALGELVDRYAGTASDTQRQLFAQSLAAALSLDETRDLIRGLGFPAESVQATSDRHWTWDVRCPA